MMDILIPLLFMAIVYAVPRLWRKLLENYVANRQQPVVREQDLREQQELSRVYQETSTYEPSSVEQHRSPVTPVPTVSSALEERSVWQGKMDANAVINGMIFAEIIQPPRAYRPFVIRK
jgi:hypothetical protein